MAKLCPFCAASISPQKIVLTERYFGMGDTFAYSICDQCGSIYIEDTPADLAKYYPRDYYSYAGERRGLLGHLDRYVLRQHATSYLALLNEAGARFSEHSVIYDVGSGDGKLLRIMQGLGYPHVIGIDPFLDTTINTGGVKVLRMSLEAVAERRPGTADLVMFHHSLEHFPDPTATMAVASRLLAPGGLLLVRIPVVNYAWELYGEHWFGLETPRHFAIPTPDGMTKSAKRAGFSIVQTRYDSVGRQFVASNAYVKGESFVDAFAPSPPRTLFRMVTSVGYEFRARRLNAQSRGDQAAFVLRPKPSLT